MTSLLLALLLLFLFADAAQASDFPFDPFTIDSSINPPYGDPEGLLSLCSVCDLSDLSALCTHGLQRVLPSIGIERVLRAADILEHPEWPRDAYQFDPSTSQVPRPTDPTPFPTTMASISRQSGQVGRIDNDDMAVWTTDTYNPGWGLEDDEPPVVPLARKRLKRNTNGFPCSVGGCDSVFDRQCDLDRHCKTSHISTSDRPYKCTRPRCDSGFVYPKDLRRHESTHSKGPKTHSCPIDTCECAFSRKDNLQRHVKNKHSDHSMA